MILDLFLTLSLFSKLLLLQCNGKINAEFVVGSGWTLDSSEEWMVDFVNNPRGILDSFVREAVNFRHRWFEFAGSQFSIVDPPVSLGQYVRMFDIVIGIEQYSSNMLPSLQFL